MAEPTQEQLAALKKRFQFKPELAQYIGVGEDELPAVQQELITMAKNIYGKASPGVFYRMAYDAGKTGNERLRVLFDEQARILSEGQAEATEEYQREGREQAGAVGRVFGDTLQGARNFARGATAGATDYLESGVAQLSGGLQGLVRGEGFGAGAAKEQALLQGGREMIEREAESTIGGKALGTLGHIGGLVVPAGWAGKAGTALRMGENAGRFSRALGVIMGGRGANTARAGIGGMLSRAAIQGNNLALTGYLQSNLMGAQDLTAALARGEISKGEWLENLGQMHADSLKQAGAGWLTGFATPAFAGGASKLKNAILRGGGSEWASKLGEQTWKSLFKAGDAKGIGRVFTAKTLEGAVEFTPFTMLHNFTDEEGKFTAGTHILMDSFFSGDPEKRAHAREELLVEMMAGAMMKLGKTGKIGAPPPSRGDVQKSRLKLLESLTAMETPKPEAEAAPSGAVKMPPHVEKAVRDVIREVLPEMAEADIDASLLKVLEAFDAVAAARGDTEWIPVRDRLKAAMETEAPPKLDDMDTLTAEQDAAAARMEEALRSGDQEGFLRAQVDLGELDGRIRKLAEGGAEDFPAQVENQVREHQQARASVEEAGQMLNTLEALIESGLPSDRLGREAEALFKRNEALREIYPDWESMRDTFDYNPDGVISNARRSLQATAQNLQIMGESLNMRRQIADQMRGKVEAERRAEADKATAEADAIFGEQRAAEEKEVARGKKVLGEKGSDDPVGDLRAAAARRRKQGKEENALALDRAADVVENHPNIRAVAEKGRSALEELPGIGKKVSNVILGSFGLDSNGKPLTTTPASEARPKKSGASKPVTGGKGPSVAVSAEGTVTVGKPKASPAKPASKPKAEAPAPVSKKTEAKKVLKGEREKTAAKLKEERRKNGLDEMTGLGNKTAFSRAKARVDADPDQGVAVIDGDNFGQINKEKGHAAGDRLIQKMAKDIKALARRFGLSTRGLFRFGGDEFVVTGPKEKVRQFVREVNNVQTEYANLKGGKKVTMSAGYGDTFDAADSSQSATKKAKKAAAPKAEPALPTEKATKTVLRGPRKQGGTKAAGESAPSKAPEPITAQLPKPKEYKAERGEAPIDEVDGEVDTLNEPDKMKVINGVNRGKGKLPLTRFAGVHDGKRPQNGRGQFFYVDFTGGGQDVSFNNIKTANGKLDLMLEWGADKSMVDALRARLKGAVEKGAGVEFNDDAPGMAEFKKAHLEMDRWLNAEATRRKHDGLLILNRDLQTLLPEVMVTDAHALAQPGKGEAPASPKPTSSQVPPKPKKMTKTALVKEALIIQGKDGLSKSKLKSMTKAELEQYIADRQKAYASRAQEQKEEAKKTLGQKVDEVLNKPILKPKLKPPTKSRLIEEAQILMAAGGSKVSISTLRKMTKQQLNEFMDGLRKQRQERDNEAAANLEADIKEAQEGHAEAMRAAAAATTAIERAKSDRTRKLRTREQRVASIREGLYRSSVDDYERQNPSDLRASEVLKSEAEQVRHEASLLMDKANDTYDPALKAEWKRLLDLAASKRRLANQQAAKPTFKRVAQKRFRREAHKLMLEAQQAEKDAQAAHEKMLKSEDPKLRAEILALAEEASRISRARFVEAENHRIAVQKQRASQINDPVHSAETGYAEVKENEAVAAAKRYHNKAKADLDHINTLMKRTGITVEKLPSAAKAKREAMRELVAQTETLMKLAELSGGKRKTLDLTTPGSKPVPQPGTIYTFRTADGPVTGLVTQVGKMVKGKRILKQGELPGRRIKIIDMQTLAPTSIRINDILDLSPKTIGDIQVFGTDALSQIQAEKQGAELTYEAFLGLLSARVDEPFTTIKNERGLGSAEDSIERVNKLLMGEIDGEWKIVVPTGKKQVETGRYHTKTTEKHNVGDPIMRTITTYSEATSKDVMDAVKTEALVRHHRMSNSAPIPEDYLMEAISRMQVILDRVAGRKTKVRRLKLGVKKTRSEKKLEGKFVHEKRKRGEKKSPEDVMDDMRDAYLEREGQVTYFDPREITFDFFNKEARQKTELELGERIEALLAPRTAANGSVWTPTMSDLKPADQELAVRWGQYKKFKSNYLKMRADLDARSSLVDEAKQRRIGFNIIHPQGSTDVRAGDKVMVSIRSRNELGHQKAHSYWEATVTPERTIFLRPLNTVKERVEWLAARGVDAKTADEVYRIAQDAAETTKQNVVDRHRFIDPNKANQRTRDLMEVEDIVMDSAWGKTAHSRFQQGMDAIAKAVWREDFSGMKELGFSEAEMKRVQKWINNNREGFEAGSPEYIERTIDWLHQHDGTGRHHISAVRRGKKGSDARANEFDSGLVEDFAALGNMRDPNALQVDREAVRDRDVTDPDLAGENGLLMEMIRRGDAQFDPITGGAARQNKDGQFVVRGGPSNGLVLHEGVFFTTMGAMRSLGRTAGHVSRLGEGLVDATIDGIYAAAIDPIANIVMNHERIIDLIPGMERFRPGLEASGSRLRRFITRDDPDGGITAFMNEMHGTRKLVDEQIHKILEPIRKGFDSTDLLNVDAAGNVTGMLADMTREGVQNNPALKDFVDKVNEVGQRLVDVGLLKQEQLNKWKDRYFHYGRFVHSADAIDAKLKDAQDSYKQANQEIRAMVAAGKPKIEIASKQKEVNAWKALVDSLKQNRRGLIRKKEMVTTRHPIDAIDLTDVSRFRARGFGRKRTMETIEEAIQAGLDWRSPIRLMHETLAHEWYAAEQAEWFKRVADDGRFVKNAELAPDHWVTVESLDKVMDPTWSEFVGKKVHPQMYDWLKMHEPHRWTAVRKMRYAESGVKLAVTLGNPGNWMQQVLGNPLLMAAGGVPMTRMLWRYGEGFKDIMMGKDREFYLKKNWLDQATDADREFDRWLKETGMDVSTAPVDSIIGTVYDTIRSLMTERDLKAAQTKLKEVIKGGKRLASKDIGSGVKAEVRDFVHIMSHLYRSLDAAARIGMYKELRSQGKSDEAATKVVNDIFDLQHISTFGRAVRAMPIPLLADSFASVKAAMFRNHKKIMQSTTKGYLAYMGMAALWNSIAAGIEGREDSEVQADIEASTPASNPFTHWLDTRTTFWIPGRGALDTQRWMPTGPMNDYIPGMEALLEGIGGKLFGMEGPLRNRYGQTLGQQVQARLLGSGSVSMGRAAQVYFDRDERGRPGIRRRYEEPGPLGFTGVPRALMETGMLPAFGMTLFTKTPYLRTAIPATIMSHLTRAHRSEEMMVTWISDDEISEQVMKTRFKNGTVRTPSAEDDVDYVARVFGFRFLKPNALARQKEKLAFTPGTKQDARGQMKTDETRQQPNTPEGMKARYALSRTRNIDNEWKALTLYGMVMRHRDYMEAGEDDAASTVWERIKRRWPDADNLAESRKVLARMGLKEAVQDLNAHIKALYPDRKDMKEEFPRALPVKGRKILKTK